MANLAPVLDNSGTVTLGAIASDIPIATNLGVSLSELIGSLITDPNGDPTGIAITGADNANGTWQYSLNGGTTWTNFGTVSDSSSLILGAYTLYSGLLGNKPTDQPWLDLGVVDASAPLAPTPNVETAISGGVKLDTQAKNDLYAGYGNKGFDVTLNGFQPVVTTNLVNSDFPELDADKGFSVAFSINLDAESRTNQNRAGFSILVTTKTNTKAIELGFQKLGASTGKIFAQGDGATPNPGGEPVGLFIAAESVSFNTSQVADYELKILGNSYTLFADGTQILTGPLRNYTAFSGIVIPAPPPFQNLVVDPYEEPNVVFLGDNTTSAQASTNLYQAALKTQTRVRFQPNAGFDGTSNFTFRAWDTTDGKSNGDRVNTVSNGSSTAFSQAFETATITITGGGDGGTGGGDDDDDDDDGTGGGDGGTGGGDGGTGGGDGGTGGGDGGTGGGDGDTGGGDGGGGTPLQIEFIGTAGNDTLTGNAANNLILGLAGGDRLVGGEGDDILVGGLGRDTYDGGPGVDVHVFAGATQRAALKTSTVRQPDRILNFGATDIIRFDFDNNPATVDLPKKLFNAGKIRAKNLESAVQLAFADKNQKRRGAQTLKALEATFFTYRGVTHLTYNDRNAGFNPRTDLLVAMPGMQFDAGDASRGALRVSNYFG